MRMSKRLGVISLGQGQGPRAEGMLLQAIEDGSWVFFQVLRDLLIIFFVTLPERVRCTVGC